MGFWKEIRKQITWQKNAAHEGRIEIAQQSGLSEFTSIINSERNVAECMVRKGKGGLILQNRKVFAKAKSNFA